jgi:hypothetical protein
MSELITLPELGSIVLAATALFFTLAALRLYVRMLAADVYREKRKSQLLLMKSIEPIGDDNG